MNSPDKQARYEEWNLEVQKELRWNLVASAQPLWAITGTTPKSSRIRV